MVKAEYARWRHEHIFGQERPMPGERRTLIVIVITGLMMVVEIVAGVLFGSMALLADGLHMASHAVALTVAYFAYIYARRRAHDDRFSVGTGKVNSLAGFAGAVLLAVFACMMAWESIDRFAHPVAIRFNQAILVAIVGLIVNAVSAVILSVRERGEHAHDHAHASGDRRPHYHDYNLRSAYLHVLADALTSLLAIAALLAGKYLRAAWLDPTMGVVGAVLVARWSLGLIRATSWVLLDRQAPERIRNAIRQAVESDGVTRITDLHVWAISPTTYTVIVAVVTESLKSADDFKARLPSGLGLAHVTVEVNRAAVTPEQEHDHSRMA